MVDIGAEGQAALDLLRNKMLAAAERALPNGYAVYPTADVQALAQALEDIINGETRMNPARAALAKFKEPKR